MVTLRDGANGLLSLGGSILSFYPGAADTNAIALII